MALFPVLVSNTCEQANSLTISVSKYLQFLQPRHVDRVDSFRVLQEVAVWVGGVTEEGDIMAKGHVTISLLGLKVDVDALNDIQSLSFTRWSSTILGRKTSSDAYHQSCSNSEKIMRC